MRRVIPRFLANADGNAAIEYSLIVAGIALGLIMGLTALSEQLQDTYAAILAGVASLSRL
jgi:Flp pilus assembly pilin Flp